jgi:hypothetical protein
LATLEKIHDAGECTFLRRAQFGRRSGFSIRDPYEEES